MRPIVLTGPESSGKSTLAQALGKELNLPLLSEYAREYLEGKTEAYTYEDVIQMAREQLRREEFHCTAYKNQCILDTDLTVFSIWLKEKYGKTEDWIEESIAAGKHKLYLLCNVDLPWTPDPLREHSALSDRQRLFQDYKTLMEKYNLNYHVISGTDVARLKNALKVITDRD